MSLRLDLAIYSSLVINRATPVPPWEQLAAIFRARIQSGELPPGERLPSVLALAEEYGLARGTVQKAVSQLKREGLVEARTGWGTFVAGGGQRKG